MTAPSVVGAFAYRRFNAPERMLAVHTRSFSLESGMLETIAVVLLVLWLLGLVSSYTMGGFIHVLLVIAIVVFLIRVLQGRRM